MRDRIEVSLVAGAVIFILVNVFLWSYDFLAAHAGLTLLTAFAAATLVFLIDLMTERPHG
jgi:hypothetical protein